MTSAHAKVSAVMCTFNGARYLDLQLQSIADQTRPVNELVIADDGSTDTTPAILADWSRRMEKRGVRVVRLHPLAAPLGVAQNFERGLKAASGDVVVLSDQDDAWAPDRVAVSLAALQGPVRLVFANAHLIDAHGSRLEQDLFGALRVSASERALVEAGRGLDALVRRNVVTGATVALTREVLDTALPIPPHWVHDEWLAIVAAARTYGEPGIAILAHPAIEYRLHGANVIGVELTGLRGRLARLSEPRRGRLERLAARASELHDWARQQELPGAALSIIEGKDRFERARSAIPASRLRRSRAIARAHAQGGYSRFASQGKADIVRDAIQPA